VVSIAFGLLAGLVVGGAGGALLRAARRRGWIDRYFGGPTVLALALLAYVAALVVDGNGFVAAFVGGLAFRNACGRQGEREVEYAEQSAAAVSLIVWLLFGAAVVPVVLARFDWRIAVYAVLSLTAVRMVAVAVALVGSGVPRSTVAFMGWFGPRGLASVIFALLAVESLGPDAATPVAAIGFTVLLSVVAHGVTASPLAARYGAAVAPSPAGEPAMPVRHLAVRHRPRPPTVP
jgi:NhaP-type Na+/H+ or K+/H+ antiporter